MSAVCNEYPRTNGERRTRESLHAAAEKRPAGAEWLGRAAKIQRGDY